MRRPGETWKATAMPSSSQASKMGQYFGVAVLMGRFQACGLQQDAGVVVLGRRLADAMDLGFSPPTRAALRKTLMRG